MPEIDIEPILERVRIIVAHAELAPGCWKRYTRTEAEDRDATPNPYGCADAVNILSTLGEMPRDEQWRLSAIHQLQSMQGDDGLFHESTHHEIHCTAHCLAALNLLGAGPARSLTGLHAYTSPAAVGPFLDALDWVDNPWGMSHRGAGLYAALHLAGESTPQWEDAYFQWLWDEADPETGMWRRGCVGPVERQNRSRFPHLAGSFHYLFNHEHARRPLRYPDAWIDFCLALPTSDPFPIGPHVGFAEIDWVYCLSRASRQTSHRWQDVRAALEAFAPRYVDQLKARNPSSDPQFNDLHSLFGALCCLAELQAVLPGRLRSVRPLHLVLDRRPFI